MGGRKSPFPITLAIGLYNGLYYRTSRDYVIRVCYVFYGHPLIQVLLPWRRFRLSLSSSEFDLLIDIRVPQQA